jgi:predicted nucleotide-binding protein
MATQLRVLVCRLEAIFAELLGEVEASNLIGSQEAFEKLVTSFDELRRNLPEDSADKAFRGLDYSLLAVSLFLKERNFEAARKNLYEIRLMQLPAARIAVQYVTEQAARNEAIAKELLAKLAPKSKNVFIAHGRDFEPAEQLKGLLLESGLNPVILEEEATGGSKSVMEKLEEHSEVCYAFVILTPDDLEFCKAGVCRENAYDVTQELHELSKFNIQKVEEVLSQYYEKGTLDLQTSHHIRGRDSPESDVLSPPRDFDLYIESGLKDAVAKSLREHLSMPRRFFRPRARQNVVMEFGYFVGKLGRERVCCLSKGEVEPPSNMLGLVYLHFDRLVDEVRGDIIRELKKADIL